MSKYAQVQKQQKQLPYTIKPIGDELALKYWKEYRAQVNATYKAEAATRYSDRRDNAVSFVSNQEVNPFKYSPAEREELEVRKARLKAAEARLRGWVDAARTPPSEDAPPAPTLFQKIKQFFKGR